MIIRNQDTNRVHSSSWSSLLAHLTHAKCARTLLLLLSWFPRCRSERIPGFRKWYPDPDSRASAGALGDGAGASQLAGSLVHGVQAHPDAMPSRDAFPIVTDFEMDGLSVNVKAQQAVLCLGMACDIGQGFLHDTIDGHLHSGWQMREGSRCIKSHLEPLVL